MAPAGFPLLTSVCLGIQAVIVVFHSYQMGLESDCLAGIWVAGRNVWISANTKHTTAQRFDTNERLKEPLVRIDHVNDGMCVYT